MIGAILGAVLVWLAYLPHWRVTRGPGIEARRLRDRPGDPQHRRRTASAKSSAPRCCIFGILAIAANAQTLSKPGDVDLSFVFSRGLQPLLVGVLVLGIGLSLGGPTGYAINPGARSRPAPRARDPADSRQGIVGLGLQLDSRARAWKASTVARSFAWKARCSRLGAPSALSTQSSSQEKCAGLSELKLRPTALRIAR